VDQALSYLGLILTGGSSGPKKDFAWGQLPGLQTGQPPFTQGLDQFDQRIQPLMRSRADAIAVAA